MSVGLCFFLLEAVGDHPVSCLFRLLAQLSFLHLWDRGLPFPYWRSIKGASQLLEAAWMPGFMSPFTIFKAISGGLTSSYSLDLLCSFPSSHLAERLFRLTPDDRLILSRTISHLNFIFKIISLLPCKAAYL